MTQQTHHMQAAQALVEGFLAHRDDSTQQTIALSWLKQYLADINIFLDDHFNQQTHIATLIHARALLIDYLIKQLWLSHQWEKQTITLVAVGGYGRAELHPHSDIDFMILTQDSLTERNKHSIERFLTQLWDTGLEIGHSVRTLKDCIKLAKNDITIATNLTEARLISGDEKLFKKLEKKMSSRLIWSSKAFFKAKLEEQTARYQKQHDSAYNLEPNIKKTPGGLRDIHMIGWVAKRHFGTKTLRELVSRSFLTNTEFNSLIKGQEFLWKVRYALHMVSGRSEDRLLFDHQRKVASLLGYRDQQNEQKNVEGMMKQYYRTVMELSELNDMLLQYFEENLLNRKKRPKSISNEFEVINHYIAVKDAQIFLKNPSTLLKLFVEMAKHPSIKGVRASTIRLIRAHRHLIDKRFRHNPVNQALFMSILRQPRGIYDQLHRMKRYGILGAYIPAYGRIIGQMQFDLFHSYTVDEHTLFVIRNIRHFNLEGADKTFPVCAKIIKTIEKPELLYLAALFHDIAKGRGGDHSELGMSDALEFCKRHGLNNYESRLVTWLVQNHLLLSLTAQKKDLSDPDVINHFASLVRDRTHLDYLYILTVADICATNYTLWNGWRSSLLRQLYSVCFQALTQGLDTPVNSRQLIKETKLDALALLESAGHARKDIIRLWRRHHSDYFLRCTANEINWHTQILAKHTDKQKPIVTLRKHPRHAGTEILIYCPDQDYLFSTMTTAIYQLGLNILSARLATDKMGYALDVYYVLENSGEDLTDKYRIEEVIETIAEQLLHSDRCIVPKYRKPHRRIRQFNLPTQITFKDDFKNNRTIMEITSLDYPGLLSRIANVFFEYQILLQTAKITTIGERVEDVLFITDHQKQPLTDPKQQQALRQKITQVLEAE